MRFRVAFAILLGLGFGSYTSAQEKVEGGAPVPIVPANNAIKDAASYGIGFNVGSDLASQKITDKDIDSKDFLMGVLDALTGREPKLNDAQLEAAFAEFGKRMQKKMLELAKANLDKAKAFLEENKKKDGVQVTKTGLQYIVLKSGNGKQPTVTDSVVCHYEGKFLDGKVFDSSIAKGAPATFPVARVVPGWTEALQRMKVGDKWQLFIPPNLGYGERGHMGIGPNEALVFELELIDVIKNAGGQPNE